MSKMLSGIKRQIALVIGKFGFEVRRTNKIQPRDPMTEGLARLHDVGIALDTIVDVGASNGGWSLIAKKFWPGCNFLLVEPLEERRTELEELTQVHTNFHYVLCAAGKEAETVPFHITDDLLGSAIANDTGKVASGHIRNVEIARIDELVKRKGLKGSTMIKLDTHGFEIPIIEGCDQVMDQVVVFIIESYGFQIAEGSKLFWEMCDYMDKLGFRVFDVVDVMHRPKDGVFWQCDIFFIRKEHMVFENNQYA